MLTRMYTLQEYIFHLESIKKSNLMSINVYISCDVTAMSFHYDQMP